MKRVFHLLSKKCINLAKWHFADFLYLTYFHTSNLLWCNLYYHQPMVVIPIEKAFASRSYTVVSAASLTHDDPLSTSSHSIFWTRNAKCTIFIAVITRYIPFPQSSAQWLQSWKGRKLALEPCLQQQQQQTSTN